MAATPSRPYVAPARAPAAAPAAVAAPVAHPAVDSAEDRHWRGLARRLGVPFLDAIACDPLGSDVPPPDREVFVRAECLLLGEGDAAVLVMAPRDTVSAAVEDQLARHPDLARRVAIAAPRRIRRALIERHRAALVGRAVRSVLDRDPALSAAGAVSLRQVAFVGALVAAWVAAVLDLSHTLLVAWTALFLGLGILRAHVADTVPEPEPGAPLADADLPRFAVLVPLHREAAVVADLVAALGRLDYPPDRLDLRLVVEADDLETCAAVEAAVVDTPIEMIAVPPAEPRTKPKALNFALQTIDAPFVTVYDAEDRPDPDQLRRAAAAFRAGGPDLAVVQAALEIDHADDARPWLVRQFELEYAVLFHGILPWLARHRLFLPLGGTSNHFRRSALESIGAWDPHNVTEDADVAVRLMRARWRADVIPSSTLEEAPLDLARWRAQRVRWLKGWMQTWLVHMRRPGRFHRDSGLVAALSFHLVLAGQLASVLVFAPSLVVLLVHACGLLPLFGDRGFVDDILLMASLFGFCTGVVGSVVLAGRVAGLGTAARRRRPTRLVDLLTMPVYWCLVSWASYRALAELVTAPHRWNKTAHGLAGRPADPATGPAKPTTSNQAADPDRPDHPTAGPSPAARRSPDP